MRRRTLLTAIPLAIALTPAVSALAQTGVDPTRGCVYNGFDYSATGDIAEGPHCYTTPDDASIAKVAEVDPSKTLADLRAVQNWSPLHPDHYVAAGTMATRIVIDAPRAKNSSAIAAFVNELPKDYAGKAGFDWLRTGANIGGGVAAHDNIPIYTVDSSNPHQEFAEFDSSDKRVTTFAKLYEMTSGRIPLPSWAVTSGGKDNNLGGDRSFAIFDVATGIMRGYFHAVKNAAGVWQYSSAGYWYGDAATRTAGKANYWLGYLQGSSSVIGVSNELTQIGAEEVRRGVINHMVSVTFPSYQKDAISFPAKQTDGRLDNPNAPWAGQVFTLPADLDIDAYAAEHNIDVTTAAIMRAVQRHGGIVSDQNTWAMAFNFESPFGMGVRAEKPDANPWRDDPELAAKVGAMRINNFPWELTQWLPVNYAGKLDNYLEEPPRLPEDEPTTEPTTPEPSDKPSDEAAPIVGGGDSTKKPTGMPSSGH